MHHANTKQYLLIEDEVDFKGRAVPEMKIDR
jgi:hypothetical protein